MNTRTTLRRRTPASLRAGFPLASAVLAALAMAAFYLASVFAPALVPIVRLLAFFPVSLASYRRRDWRQGIGYIALFASVFLWQAGWTVWGGARASGVAGAVTASLLLVAISSVMRSIAAARGTQETLADEVRERGELLDRTTNLERVAAFVCEEAKADLEADDAGLLVPNPVDDRWELYTTAGVMAPPADNGEPLRLATWLARQSRSVLIEDLWTDGRFQGGGAVRSLLARPLARVDGSPLAVLVLTHDEPGMFGPEHFAVLEPLARTAETALAHAGSYERVGWAVDRLANQLATIQRVARELNTTLHPEAIAERTLHAAVAIAGADAGGILLEPGSFVETTALTSGALSEAARDKLPGIRELPRPDLVKQRGAEPGSGFTGNWLLVPIRQGDTACGGLLLECARERGFGRQDLQAISALASHAAVALENARLFREIATEREKSQQIVDNMADGLLILDRDGGVRSLNPAAERVLGHPASEVIGRSLCELLDCGLESCGPTCAAVAGMLVGQPAGVTTWRVRSAVTRPAYLRLSCSPLPAPGAGVVALARDVTRDEELAQFQREVISLFSHELRSPLANIMALAEVVLDVAGDERPALSRDQLEMLRLQARRLANLSQRTLDVARLDAGTWQLEARPLPVVALARDAIRRWESAAPGRVFALNAAGEALWAWGDEDAAGLILDNLLENAVKYAPADSPVTVTVNHASSTLIAIGVEDCGSPVPPGERALLFERFYRRESSTARSTYGYGLGLYIARKLSQAMGGDAWLEANSRGNRFVFTLPRLERHGQDPDRRG